MLDIKSIEVVSMDLLIKISDSLLEYDPDETVQFVEEALNNEIEAKTILSDGLIKGMDKVGELFKNNEIFVPEVTMAAECLQEAVDILKPYLSAEDLDNGFKIVIGTVEGDIHDIGKNLIIVMMEGAGFKVIDLGCNVKAEAFIQAAKENNADIIACSALLTTTMAVMPEVARLAKAEDFDKDVKLIFGGAPVYEKWALENGADGYSDDAASAVMLVKKLLNL